MSLTITSSGGTATYTDGSGTPGFTGITGKYWLSCDPKEAKHRKDKVKPPATDGAAVVRHGFDSRRLERIEVVYVANSEAACMSAYATDHDALANKACSIAYLGQSYAASELERFGKIKGPKATSQNGMYRMHCMLEFDQVRQN